MESTARLMAHEIIDAHQQARWRVPSRRRAACFGQARREANEFIAFLKLGIALDVVAKGGRAGGILALARAVFDKADNDVIASDNRTLKQIVETLYTDGRSKIAGRWLFFTSFPLS